MTPARLSVLLCLAAAAAASRAQADEVNAWPAYVLREDPSGQARSQSYLGPLFFSGPAPAPDAGHVSGFRPFYVQQEGGGSVKTDILYPLFFYRRYGDTYKWSVFQLINQQGVMDSFTPEGRPTDRRLDVWPFYFSHETADPAETYHAVLPIYGTLRNQLGYERLSWALFPLYVEGLRKGTQATYAPFPFVRVLRGAESGFGVWPLLGATRGPGAARRVYCLWPLIWDNTQVTLPGSPAGSVPGNEVGFLPFYERYSSPEVVSEDYLWPFFGYTERAAPYRYSERRYFWPFLVQGQGADMSVNRWGPFFTHSSMQGVDSTWVGWPLWHRMTWVDGDISQSKTQFFYFIYWSQDETSVRRPSAAPAYKRHIWPLVSIWDNGAGSRQVQFPSPIEVFFPYSPDMRETWAPFFSLYRYDRRPTGETRSSLLWDAVTWRRNAGDRLVELHLGPLLGMRRAPSGLRWSVLGFDFGAKPGEDRQASR
jgi:hypothetical protein